MNETITKKQVQDILNNGGIVFPYPRLGVISINGMPAKNATKDAMKIAQEYIKQWRLSKSVKQDIKQGV